MEQKDAEFYYDFSRLLILAPVQGIFIGLSYEYEGCMSRWMEAFEKLLAAARTDFMKELAMIVTLAVPDRDRLTMFSYGWSSDQKDVTGNLGKVPLE